MVGTRKWWGRLALPSFLLIEPGLGGQKGQGACVGEVALFLGDDGNAKAIGAGTPFSVRPLPFFLRHLDYPGGDGVIHTNLVVHVGAAGPLANDLANGRGSQPAGAVWIGGTVTFGEAKKVQEKLGLVGLVVRGEIVQMGTESIQFLLGKLARGNGVVGFRGLFVGFVPAAHGQDVVGHDGSAVGQVGGNVLACVTRGHSPGGQEGGGVGGGQVLEPNQVGGEMIQDLGTGAKEKDAHRH